MTLGMLEMLQLFALSLDFLQKVRYSVYKQLLKISLEVFIEYEIGCLILFKGAIATTVGQGIGPIYLDEVTCMGDETRLAECLHKGIASHDCSHSQDAGVVCRGEYNNTDAHSHNVTTTAGFNLFKYIATIIADIF